MKKKLCENNKRWEKRNERERERERKKAMSKKNEDNN